MVYSVNVSKLSLLFIESILNPMQRKRFPYYSLVVLMCFMISIILASCLSKTNLTMQTNIPKEINIESNSDSIFPLNQPLDIQSEKYNLSGTIIFSAASRTHTHNNELFLTNPEGLVFSKLHGSYYGQIALDHSGRLIATRCGYQDDYLCILDLSQTINYSTFPLPTPSIESDLKIKELKLPVSCQWNEDSPRQIISIEWTRNNDLVLVCSGPQDDANEEVWEISLDGTENMWEKDRSIGITKVIPSPTEDTYLVNSGFKNSIVDDEGNVIFDLPDGKLPAWSPDGNRIALFAFTNPPRNGLAIYDLETKKQSWIYKQPEQDNASRETFICGFCGGNENGRISWSPDGTQLVFSASHFGSWVTALFIADLLSGKISYLIPSLQILDRLSSPTWSAIDYQ